MRVFVSHALDDLLSVDSRLMRTLHGLFMRPGLLTAEYLAGRRMRYTQPLPLYLLAAAAFFFVASVRPFLWVDIPQRMIVGALPGMTVGNELAAGRLRDLAAAGVSLELFAERFVDSVNQWLPAFLVASVLLFSLVVYLLCFRRERQYLPHAILALHWTAFYLMLMAAMRLLPTAWRVQDLSVPIGVFWLTLAIRRVYAYGWAWSVGKALLLMFSFLLILVIWVQAAVGIGVLIS